MQRVFAPGKTFSFVITLGEQEENGEVIGTLGMTLPTEISLATIGYDISPNHWRKGYITEALSPFLTTYWKTYPEGLPGSKLDESGRVSVNAVVRETNAASLKVLEKAGFVCVAQEVVKGWHGGPAVVIKRFRIWKPVE